jgi:hypothetical protein
MSKAMFRSSLRASARKLGIIGALIAAATLSAGCTAVRFGYNQGPEFAYWWLDRYVDFNDTQSSLVREALGDWFAWHRRTELPTYATLVERARREMREPASAERMCRWFDEIRTRTDSAVDRASPAMARIALTMTPPQIAHLQRQYAKRNVEFRDEFLQQDPGERREASVQRAVKRFERFYGQLDDAQQQVIAQWVADSPFDPERWMAEREARQRDVLQTIRRLQAERAAPDAVASIKGLALRMQRSPDDAYRGYQQRLVQYNCEFAARVHNATTPAQREAAARRFKGWEDDFRALVGAVPATRAAFADPAGPWVLAVQP